MSDSVNFELVEVKLSSKIAQLSRFKQQLIKNEVKSTMVRIDWAFKIINKVRTTSNVRIIRLQEI